MQGGVTYEPEYRQLEALGMRKDQDAAVPAPLSAPE